MELGHCIMDRYRKGMLRLAIVKGMYSTPSLQDAEYQRAAIANTCEALADSESLLHTQSTWVGGYLDPESLVNIFRLRAAVANI